MAKRTSKLIHGDAFLQHNSEITVRTYGRDADDVGVTFGEYPHCKTVVLHKDDALRLADLIVSHLHALAHPGPNGETAEQLLSSIPTVNHPLRTARQILDERQSISDQVQG